MAEHKSANKSHTSFDSTYSYLIKIKNPTDSKHELIIGSNGTENAKSNGINPGKNKDFVFNSNTTGIFEYHCEYHPDTMKGIIEISSQEIIIRKITAGQKMQ
jgi:hypothetical protein